MNEYFVDSRDHLLAELKRIEIKVQAQIEISRRRNSRGKDEKFLGLIISEEEVDDITRRQAESSRGTEKQALLNVEQSLKNLEADIAAKENESLHRGQVLRLHHLERAFNLSRFDIDTLLTCVLPELDLKYQKVYAYLQDDVTRRHPTVDLVLRLLSEPSKDNLKGRQAFLPTAPPIKYHLLYLDDTPSQRPVSLLAKSLHVEERVVNYLLEVDQIDARLLPFTHLVQPEVKLSEVILPDQIKHRLSQLASHYGETGIICCFQGSAGVGKGTAAEALCNELGTSLLVVDMDRMIKEEIPPDLSVPLIFREAKLRNAALYLKSFDALFSDGKGIESTRDGVMQELQDYSRWVFLAGEKTGQHKGILPDKLIINVEFSTPSATARKELWQRSWAGRSYLSNNVDLNELADRFRLSGGQIRSATDAAISMAIWRDPEKTKVTEEDLYSACRQQSTPRLNSLARKIHPKYKWADIVLPKDQLDQLHEICNYVKYCHTVYSDWAFGQKFSLGKGLNILFTGSSGTGKTMAAEIITNELGIDLYKIDLSAIVSKYIGETEKNLERIFKEAETANAILFFDEADALFGKRSEVRDSHDRYANIEISYLLQKMEEYDGVVILATNLRKNMDDAFARRMHFTVEFPMPEESDRYRIWQCVFPKEAPLAGEVDFSFLARQFKISGGNIKNITLGAAFLAAADGGSINMKNLIWATKREYQKMGKLCTESDFAEYFGLVKG